MDYESTRSVESTTTPGVRYTIAKVSFGRRTELLRRIRELAGKVEFLEAGSDPREKLEAAVLESEIEKAYLAAGLLRIEGLQLDGKEATAGELVASGPEPLCREILTAVKAEFALNADERKN